MGNCQAIDSATLVIQHPSGKVEKFYAPVSATHVMKTNPGHYVALLISTTLCPTKDKGHNYKNTNPVRLTRIKLLKPTDTLVLGQVYRLITAQEVMKGLRERQKAKMRQNMSESGHKPDLVKEKIRLEKEKATTSLEDNQVTKHERSRPSNNNVGGATAKTRFWQPSLQSISEAAS
ncbi:hypothetical protein RJT34_01227 [Clitoria ternatea]|uniref:DUF4228 domain-containing protein n=1 Tax=Clitoria ternatea TaxID=43366 RepID=A0AAN9KGK6_CLITE